MSPKPFDINLQAWRFRELPFSIAHAGTMRRLPPIHRDPFDRMLVAHSGVDELTLVKRDVL